MMLRRGWRLRLPRREGADPLRRPATQPEKAPRRHLRRNVPDRSQEVLGLGAADSEAAVHGRDCGGGGSLSWPERSPGIETMKSAVAADLPAAVLTGQMQLGHKGRTPIPSEMLTCWLRMNSRLRPTCKRTSQQTAWRLAQFARGLEHVWGSEWIPGAKTNWLAKNQPT
jgi:hypothetical protein